MFLFSTVFPDNILLFYSLMGWVQITLPTFSSLSCGWLLLSNRLFFNFLWTSANWLNLLLRKNSVDVRFLLTFLSSPLLALCFRAVMEKAFAQQQEYLWTLCLYCSCESIGKLIIKLVVYSVTVWVAALFAVTHLQPPLSDWEGIFFLVFSAAKNGWEWILLSRNIPNI